MTVVPRSAGAAVLICDRCGAQDSSTVATQDADVVWPVVLGAGWTGSPFATGHHRCPDCDHAEPEAAARIEAPPDAHDPPYAVRPHPAMDITVVTPLADLDAGSAESLRDGLTAAVRTSRHVVLDLNAVHLIDSAGLGLLVRTHQEAKDRGGSFCLVAPSRFIRTVLHTMRLDTVLAQYPDEATAVRAARA